MIAIAGALLALAATAHANDDPTVEKPRKKLNSEILLGDAQNDQAVRPDDENWFRANIHLAKHHGFEYRRSFSTEHGKKLVFSVQGPVVKKKTPGLTFEIRF